MQRYEGEYTNLLTNGKVGSEQTESLYGTIVARPFAEPQDPGAAEVAQR
jgi:hypothetical protein